MEPEVDAEDGWNSWCITAPPQKPPRPPPLPTGTNVRASSSSAPSRCDSGCSMRREVPDGSKASHGDPLKSARSSSFSSARPVWERQDLQDSLSVNLSQPRRKRLVQTTLDAVRDAFDPAEGLAAAARAAANEVLERTPRQQRQRSTALASPREVSLPPVYVPPRSSSRTRSADSKNSGLTSQRLDSERLHALAQPRRLKNAPQETASAPATARGGSQQRRRCSELARPKPPRVDVQDLLQELALLQQMPTELKLPLSAR